MCILSKLDCAKLGVSNLFLSKVIEEKPFFFFLGGGVGSIPLVKEGLSISDSFNSKIIYGSHFLELSSLHSYCFYC